MLEKDYDPAVTAKKALSELALTAGAAILTVAAAVVGQWIVDGGATLLLPPKYLLATPFIAAAGRALLNWSKNRERSQAKRFD